MELLGFSCTSSTTADAQCSPGSAWGVMEQVGCSGVVPPLGPRTRGLMGRLLLRTEQRRLLVRFQVWMEEQVSQIDEDFPLFQTKGGSGGGVWRGGLGGGLEEPMAAN